MRWRQVKWTEAVQVTALLDWPEPEPDEGRQPPEAFFDGLREAGRLHEAAMFLGVALPRFDAVAWAARTVRDARQSAPQKPAEQGALRAALLWLQDSSDGRRRAAYAAAEEAGRQSPERFVALAVFLSGGSIAPEDVQPIPAPRDAAGRMAAGAVIAAVGRDRERLAQALAAGDAIAGEGARAGAA